MMLEDLAPYAMWSDDCQGKKDYDGRLISISTRYWPGPDGGGTMTYDTRTGVIGSMPYGQRPSAHALILLMLGPQESENDGGGEYLVWRDAEFNGDTEAGVKSQVETWVTERMRELVELMGGLTAFRKP